MMNFMKTGKGPSSGLLLIVCVAMGFNCTSDDVPPGAPTSNSGSSSSGGVFMDAGVDSRPTTIPNNELVVGGTISGLQGTGLVLTNGRDMISPAPTATSFVFQEKVTRGASYSVIATGQPTRPSQTCTVQQGSGTAVDAITNIAVRCTTRSFAVIANIVGQRGTGLVLQNNGGDDLEVAAGAAKAVFATRVESGKSYAVTIKSQPADQVCTVAGGVGEVAAGDIVSVTVNCSTTHPVGGNVLGLSGSGLVLQNNAGDDLPINMNGQFAFRAPLASGARYVVTTKSQPTNPWETCRVTNGSGSVGNDSVRSIEVLCAKNKYTVTGTVTGLSGTGLVLTNKDGDDLSVNGNGSFAFATSIESGSTYEVKVKAQPTAPAQTCNVSSGRGVITGSNVTDIRIECANNTYKVGGTVRGLRSAGLVLSQGGISLPVINSNGTFSIDVANGSPYSFTIDSQPNAPTRHCVMYNGAGLVAGKDVTNISVACDRILVIWSGGLLETMEDIKTKLLSVDLGEVDSWGFRTPDLAKLQEYSAALVFATGRLDNPSSMGDRLADYFDSGANVVLAPMANGLLPLRGRWAAEGYDLIATGTNVQPNSQGALQLLEPASPLLVGVSSLTSQVAYQSAGGAINGGVVVARWGSGGVLIVRGQKNGRNYASINMYPPSETPPVSWVGSGAEIMRNALLFR
jgi:trimeric autotransporter adhesin